MTIARRLEQALKNSDNHFYFNPSYPMITINENQSMISINKINNNLLIYIDWPVPSIKINNHSPIPINIIDFYWLLLIINSYGCATVKTRLGMLSAKEHPV